MPRRNELNNVVDLRVTFEPQRTFQMKNEAKLKKRSKIRRLSTAIAGSILTIRANSYSYLRRRLLYLPPPIEVVDFAAVRIYYEWLFRHVLRTFQELDDILRRCAVDADVSDVWEYGGDTHHFAERIAASSLRSILRDRIISQKSWN